MLTLPSEVLANIIGRLDNQTASNCSLLNKKINKVCKRYDLDKPVVDELQIVHNKDERVITATYNFQMRPERGQIQRIFEMTLQRGEEVNQQEIIDFSLSKVRSMNKLSLTNMVLENEWIDYIRKQHNVNRSIECLYLRNTTCPVDVNVFYNLVDSIDALDTDMDALATVEIGEMTYDEFFSAILPSVSLYGDDGMYAKNINRMPKYTLNTLTDAFLPRLLEVLPRQFSLADCFTKIRIRSLENIFRTALLSGAELYWHLGYFKHPIEEVKNDVETLRTLPGFVGGQDGGGASVDTRNFTFKEPSISALLLSEKHPSYQRIIKDVQRKTKLEKKSQ